LCTNATGTEKLPPLLIGRSENLFSHREDNDKFLKWNETGSMTLGFLMEYLEDLNQEMAEENRQIILFLDNASVHSRSDSLKFSSIECKFFPPNTTKKLQPMDLGIFETFKNYFREKLFRYLGEILLTEGTLNNAEVTLNDAALWIKVAWRKSRLQILLPASKRQVSTQSNKQTLWIMLSETKISLSFKNFPQRKRTQKKA
jgi:hypothetical protein